MSQKQRIDPLDPSFDQPRKIERFHRLRKDIEYYKVPCNNCKKGHKTVSVYKGKYYESEQNDSQKLRFRLTIGLASLLSFALFLLSSTLSFTYNSTWYVGLIQMVILVSYSYLIIVYIFYCLRDSQLTEYQFQTSSKSIINVSLTIFILHSLTFLSILLMHLFNQQINFTSELPGYILVILSASSILLMWRLEKKHKYHVWQSKETLEAVLKTESEV